MEIKPTLNKYGHEVVKCPFCEHNSYVRPTTKSSPNPLRDLKRHIMCKSKDEALDFIDAKEMIEKYKHLNYYRDHVIEKVKYIPTMRKLDDDLTLIKNENA